MAVSEYAENVRRLCERLPLGSHEIFTQDWEFCAGKTEHIDEYLAHYESGCSTDGENSRIVRGRMHFIFLNTCGHFFNNATKGKSQWHIMKS